MRLRSALVTAVVLSTALGACGDDESDPGVQGTSTVSDTPSPTPSPSTSPAASETPVETPDPTEEPGQRVVITIEGDAITPNGERLEVERGEVVTLEITSDRAGELHVHAKPEQYIEFEAGSSTHELVVDAPGVVDVEEHDSGHVVAQLEVQ
jgi:hypothetical protein